MQKEYFSQYQQDKFLDEHIFQGKENGFFKDIGAHDGITMNNTYYFEQHRNWRGICIEPIPKVCRKLDLNRSCIKINGCIAQRSDKSNFLRIEGYLKC